MTRGMFSNLMKRVPGVTVRRTPKTLSWVRDEREFLEFEFAETKFVVQEEGISGAYFEITPKPRGCEPATIDLRKAIEGVEDWRMRL